jgi:5-methylthioadenosine/S-adenosylhomocysteine deaminase
VRAVMIGGVPRFGLPSLLASLGAEGEEVTIGGRKRMLNLRQVTADPAVGEISLGEARERLTDALARIKELRKRQEEQGIAGLMAPPADGELRWGLALDELQPTGVELRPRLPWRRRRTGPELVAPTAAGPPLSELMVPLKLDALTVADDRDFLDRIAAEPNLPPYVAPGLKALYEA